MTPDVRKFLDLSTGHLRPSTRDALDADAGPTLTYQCLATGPYGWFVYVGEDNDEADLNACFALARRLGCEYILFNRDTDQHPDLPFYEDEGEVGA